MILPCQVQRKVEDKERAAAVETGKAKEESLKVSGARCWNRILQITGDICLSVIAFVSKPLYFQPPPKSYATIFFGVHRTSFWSN